MAGLGTKIDYIGKTYNKLTVTGYQKTNNKQRKFNCTCECGSEIIVGYANLISGHTKSCGCLRRSLTLTHVCLRCNISFQRPAYRGDYKFCSKRCNALTNRPNQFNIKKYPFDETIFSTWSDDLAWLLGLIWSDGCLFGNCVNICAAERQHLEEVIRIIKMPNGIRPKNKGQHLSINFHSRKVADRLKAVGLMEAKSYTIKWPKLPKKYYGAFVRGVLDGDGSALLLKNRRNQQVADLQVSWYSASMWFSVSLFKWLRSLGLTAKISMPISAENPCFKISIYEQKSIKKLYSILYPNLSVACLKRKREKFDKWLITPRVRSGRIKGT